MPYSKYQTTHSLVRLVRLSFAWICYPAVVEFSDLQSETRGMWGGGKAIYMGESC